MRKIGQTLATLARYRRHWSALLETSRTSHQAPPRSNRLTEVHGFGSNPGALRMFAYAPAVLPDAPALVVVLHGCTQSAASYDLGAGWSTLAERHGFVLLLPEQPSANNPKGCFNWFLPDDTRRDRGEALSIRQMIEKAILDHQIDRRRIFITGLSAGGAMASAMLASYPEVFAAGAIIAGLPYGTAVNVQQAFESMFQGRSRSGREWGDLVRNASGHRGPWPRVSIWHGDADATVVPMNAEALIRQWTDVHGIETAPKRDLVDGYPRRRWRRDGVDVVESFAITGMAHGTPLATGVGGCGEAGPFLVDMGICSSSHIAAFFGLTGVTRMQAGRSTREAVIGSLGPAAEGVEFIPDERIEILDPTSGNPEREDDLDGRIDVMAVITKALTSAGLMKPPR